MTQEPIAIALMGSFALRGQVPLEAALEVPYRLIPIPDDLSPAAQLERLAPAQVIVGVELTREMAERAAGLRLMQTVGAGVDAVDLAALPPGAALANVYFHGPGMAEYVLLGMLAMSRDLVAIHNRFRTGDWSGSYYSRQPIAPPKPELRGKTLLLLGLGTIGREVALRAQAFGMRVQGVRRQDGQPPPAGVDTVHGIGELDDLLPQADYLAVTLPLTAETEGLIDARRLALMRPTAMLVNVGRGRIIAEEPLFRALESRRIGGLVCDVWYDYPTPPFGDGPVFPSRYPFHELDNVLLTPHISAWTEGTLEGRFRAIAANINRLVRGEPLENQLLPEQR